MVGEIKSDNAAIQGGAGNATSQLLPPPGRGPGGNVDPRLGAAMDDADEAVRRRREKVNSGIDKTKEDAAGKSNIDGKGSNAVNGSGAGNPVAALGRGLQGALGSLGNGGGGMPQIPSMPGMGSPGGVGSPFNTLVGDHNGSNGFGGLSGNGKSAKVGVGGPHGEGDSDYQRRIIELSKDAVAAGIPYSWGSGDLNGPTCSGNMSNAAANAAGDYAKAGFDCSGLSRYLVYQASDIEIPRTSEQQYANGMEIGPEDALPGDLVFPNHSFEGGGPGHVQVYVGDGKVVEAQQSGTDVMFSDVGPSRFVRYVAQ
jgi:hypothetical protein